MAANVIDVVVLFSSDVNLSTAEKYANTILYNGEANLPLYNSAIPKSFALDAWPTSVSYNATNQSPTDAVEWLKNQNANPVSEVATARNSYTADIVLMIVNDWNTNDCGKAGFGAIPTNIAESYRESFAFAVVALNSHPGCDTAISIPHELGHILYAEHEYDLNGYSGLPANDNHAAVASWGKTIMRESNDPPATTLHFSGFFTRLTSPSANNKRFIHQNSWETVSRYRQPPPPSCDITFAFNYCIGNTRNYSITATLPGYTVLNADYDMQLLGTGPWIDIFEGILTCPAVNIDVWAIVRALLLTEFGVSQCSIMVPIDTCGNW